MSYTTYQKKKESLFFFSYLASVIPRSRCSNVRSAVMWSICSSRAREYAANFARIDDDTMFWTLKGEKVTLMCLYTRLHGQTNGILKCMLKPSKCSPCRHFTRWQTCRSSIPIIPAIVESLHSECSEQFALNDARTAFLLPNCICKHKSQLACAPQTCVEPLLTRMMKDKRYTHTCGWCFSAVPVWGAEKGKRHNVTFYLSSLHPQLAYSLEASRHTGTLKKTNKVQTKVGI